MAGGMGGGLGDVLKGGLGGLLAGGFFSHLQAVLVKRDFLVVIVVVGRFGAGHVQFDCGRKVGSNRIGRGTAAGRSSQHILNVLKHVSGRAIAFGQIFGAAGQRGVLQLFRRRAISEDNNRNGFQAGISTYEF